MRILLLLGRALNASQPISGQLDGKGWNVSGMPNIQFLAIGGQERALSEAFISMELKVICGYLEVGILEIV